VIYKKDYITFLAEFFEQMKPELIAPIVFWLCHENCNENGSIIEAALGWAGKCEYQLLNF